MKHSHLTLLTLTLFCCISCNEKSTIKNTESKPDSAMQVETLKNNQNIVWNTDFQNYLNQIPFLNLPLHFECSKGFEVPNIDLNNGIVKKYIPEGGTIIGKIYQNKNEAAIIYMYPADILFPEISIFNTNGKEIKKILLFEENECVREEGYFAKTVGTITPDYKIKTKTYTCRWNPEIEDPSKDTTIVENIKSIK